MSLVAVLAMSTAWADDVDECIARPVTFDGIQPLRYADASGQKGQLYSKYPKGCTAEKEGRCSGGKYVESRDAFAVAKTCGSWAYVQHIGKERISTGWVAAARLTDRGAKLPSDDGEPGGRTRPSSWREPYTIGVKLIKGNGLPVCEAYLQRLNQTVFHEPPSCGRPENAQIPGFTQLNRVPLAAADITHNYVLAYNLSHLTSDDNKLLDAPPARKDLIAVWSANGQAAGVPRAVVEPANFSVWRFEPPVDIDNDGRADNVVIWRDFPPRWDPRNPLDACGSPIDRNQVIAIDQVPFVFTPTYSSIDVARTVALFGDPAEPDARLPSDVVRPPGMDPSQPYQRVRPLGHSIDIFEYAGKYYFDTTKTTESGLVTDENRLYVYLRQGKKLREVCEYQNLDAAWEALGR